MRLTTITSAVILALSSAAIAQVATTPIERKGEANGTLANVTENLVAEPVTNTAPSDNADGTNAPT